MIDLEKIDKLLQEAKGSDFIKAERVARMMGDPTPSIIFSAKFHLHYKKHMAFFYV